MKYVVFFCVLISLSSLIYSQTYPQHLESGDIQIFINGFEQITKATWEKIIALDNNEDVESYYRYDLEIIRRKKNEKDIL